MEETRVLLQQLMPSDDPDHHVSLRALQLFRQLMIEANTQLGLFVLPEETFAKYENLIKVTLYEQMKKETFAGEDPRKALKRIDV